MVHCWSKGGCWDWPQLLSRNRHRSGAAGQDLPRHHQQLQKATTVTIYSTLLSHNPKRTANLVVFLRGSYLANKCRKCMNRVRSTAETIEPLNKRVIVTMQRYHHNCRNFSSIPALDHVGHKLVSRL